MLQYTKMQMMNLLKQLEEYRLERGLSQQKLAKLLNVDYSTLNRWFMGRRIPNKIKTYQIKKFLKEKGVKI